MPEPATSCGAKEGNVLRKCTNSDKVRDRKRGGEIVEETFYHRQRDAISAGGEESGQSYQRMTISVMEMLMCMAS